MSDVRVLQAPSNIAAQPWLIAQGLRRLGHDVKVWHYGENRFGFPADRVFEHADPPRSYVQAFRAALEEDFDVLHLHFARSLLPAHGALPWLWDLPVWRALGKRVVFTFHGSDVRRRTVDLASDEHSYYRYSDLPSDEEAIQARLQVIRAYAQHLTVGNPMNLAHVPDAVYVPKAVDVDALPFVGPVNRERPLVLHAPSRRGTKGTDRILAALEELRRRGLAFDVDLVEGVPHTELLRRMAGADIVVNAVLGADPEVLALEAMAMGKATVTRVRPPVRATHPDLPAVSADPGNVVEVLAALVMDPEGREALAAPGRTYVEANHAPCVVGRRFAELYQQPGRPVPPALTGWTAAGAQQDVTAWQARVQQVEARSAALHEEVARLRRRSVGRWSWWPTAARASRSGGQEQPRTARTAGSPGSP